MTKLSALPVITAPTSDDVILLTNDPAGTPSSGQVSLGNVKTLIASLLTAADIPSLTSAKITDFAEAADDRVAALLVAGANVTLTYNNVANTITIASTGGGSAGRERLTANRTYYIHAFAGSDSNDGLTTSTQFATVQKAVNVISSTLDLNGFTVRIEVTVFGSNGAPLPITLKDCVGEGKVQIVNPGNSGNTIYRPQTITTGQGYIEAVNLSTIYELVNIGFQNFAGGVAGTYALKVEDATLLWTITQQTELMQDDATPGIYVGYGGSLIKTSTDSSLNYVRGNRANFLTVERGGYAKFSGEVSFAPGTSTYSDAFWLVKSTGVLDTTGVTHTFISGTFSGIEHKVSLNGVYLKGAASLGGTAGTTATGGQVV